MTRWTFKTQLPNRNQWGEDRWKTSERLFNTLPEAADAMRDWAVICAENGGYYHVSLVKKQVKA